MSGNLYSVCVNAAGCLPDSETYPYTVNGLDDARQALADECSLHILSGEYGGDDVETTARYDDVIEQGGEALERGESVAVALDADGIYRLTIEPTTPRDDFADAQADVFAAIREARRYPTAANRRALDEARERLKAASHA